METRLRIFETGIESFKAAGTEHVADLQPQDVTAKRDFRNTSLQAMKKRQISYAPFK